VGGYVLTGCWTAPGDSFDCWVWGRALPCVYGHVVQTWGCITGCVRGSTSCGGLPQPPETCTRDVAQGCSLWQQHLAVPGCSSTACTAAAAALNCTKQPEGAWEEVLVGGRLVMLRPRAETPWCWPYSSCAADCHHASVAALPGTPCGVGHWPWQEWVWRLLLRLAVLCVVWHRVQHP
jgi:hypothetical protein